MSERPGYDEAVEAAFSALYGPYTTTIPREARRAMAADAIDAAYPIIEAAVGERWEAAMPTVERLVAEKERRRIVEALRGRADLTGKQQAIDFIESLKDY